MADVLSDTMEALDLTTNKPDVDPSVAPTAIQHTAEDFVDPWNVTSSSDKGIDYEKLISKLTLNFYVIMNILTFVSF